MSTDEQLIQLCMNGDRKAQNELYKVLFNNLMGVCMRYKRDKSDAVSALNMGYIKIINGLSKYDGKRDLKKWCARVMVNHLIDEYRTQASQNKHGRVYYEEEIEDVSYNVDMNLVEQEIQAEDLRNMLKLLPPVMNRVFNLCAVDGFSHQEVAEELGIAESTSRWHLAEARKRLQKMLFERYEKQEKKSVASEIG